MKRSGYTLIEVLLYMAIFTIVIGSITLVATLTTTQRVKNLVAAEVDAQGDTAMSMITQSIRNSTAISTPVIGTSGGSISLSTSTSSLNPTQYDAIANGNVTSIRLREGGAASANFLTNNRVVVSGLTFINTAVSGSNDSISVQFTMSYYNPSGRDEFNYQKTFYGAATRR